MHVVSNDLQAYVCQHPPSLSFLSPTCYSVWMAPLREMYVKMPLIISTLKALKISAFCCPPALGGWG